MVAEKKLADEYNKHMLFQRMSSLPQHNAPSASVNTDHTTAAHQEKDDFVMVTASDVDDDNISCKEDGSYAVITLR